MDYDIASEEQLIEHGKSIMRTDPMLGVFQQYSAHDTLAFHAQRVGDEDSFRSHIRQMLDVVINGYTEYGLAVQPGVQIQNDT